MRCFRMFADNANRLKRQRQSWSSSRRGCLRNIRVNGESKSRVETTANYWTCPNADASFYMHISLLAILTKYEQVLAINYYKCNKNIKLSLLYIYKKSNIIH